MTITLSRYISRLFFANIVAMLVGFSGLLLLLDLLNNADGLFQRHGDNLWVLVRYSSLRLPEIAGFLLPFATLLATLLTLAGLTQSNEILAAKAAGMSFYRLLAGLIPIAALVAAGNFFLVDRVTPHTQRILADWDADSAARSEEPVAADKDGGVWIRDGASPVRVSIVLNQGRELHDVTIFERDEGGNLTRRITADVAVYEDNGRWRLYGVEELIMHRFAGGEFFRRATDLWEGTLVPGHYADIVAPPQSLTLEQLAAFTRNDGEVGNRPSYYYETWLQKRYAVPFAVLIMVILAAPMAQSMRRNQRMAIGLVAGVGMGFLYFVAEGICQALGEAGAVPAFVAAWTPECCS
ncbi:MAG: LPS export ABC transporter permease LptG [Rhodobacteraceae bacterium]|nr:LPS export ABC transporter permease LptG [Paracoccaceae bacterium]